jgi:hypothetical protein
VVLLVQAARSSAVPVAERLVLVVRPRAARAARSSAVLVAQVVAPEEPEADSFNSARGFRAPRASTSKR